MPALTITAVDHATDQLTIPGHDLDTGDGPGAVRNIGGALPGGVAPVTDYWVIVVDANTIKLAASSADAMANTAIAIADNGTGTQMLELGIPYRRARTYVPASVSVAGAQLKSEDLNALQDAEKALHALLTNQPQTVWDGRLLAADDEVRPFYAGTWYVDTGTQPAMPAPGGLPDRVTVATNTIAYFPLTVANTRRRVKAITVFGRSFVDVTTLALFASTGIGTGAIATAALALAGAVLSINVAADGLFNPRALTLAVPSSLHQSGCPLWLKVATTATGSFAGLTYKVTYEPA